MDWSVALIASSIGYLLGSFSFARLIGRLVAPKVDVSRTELPIPGTNESISMRAVSGTAVSIHLGPKWGVLTSLFDMLKVALPTLAFRLLYPGTHYFLISAVAGVIGHNWPLYYRFKGGSGLSAIYGSMFVIDWIGVLATAVGGMILGMVVIRDVVVSYLAGLWLIIPWLWFRTHDVGYLAYGVAVNILFVLALLPEIRKVMEYRRRGLGGTAAEMDVTPMGRMMTKMANRLGLTKKA
jgi:glycerol-3-phosphate acyltransferase PlsY